MLQRKGNSPPQSAPQCPVCRHPLTKVQRRLTTTMKGSMMYICTRTGQCSVGMNLSKMETWVAV